MKRNLVMLIVLVIVGGIAAFIYSSQDTGTIRGEFMEFAVEDTASVNKIFMADKEGRTILLEMEERGRWRLNKQYMARQDAVENLLKTLHLQSMKAPVPKSAFENVVKRIATNSIKVEVYQGGEKPSKVFYVGSTNMDHSGTYMLMENSTRPFLMHIEGHKGFINSRYFTNPNEWRNTDIWNFRKGELKELVVEYPHDPNQSFKITDPGDQNFVLTALNSNEPVPYDTARLRNYMAGYKKVNFEGFEETKTLDFNDSIMAQTPFTRFTTTHTNGSTTVVNTYLKPMPGGEDFDGNQIKWDLDRLYAKANDSELLIIQYFVFDKLTYTLSDFRPSKVVNK